jgi:hypothetical protein
MTIWRMRITCRIPKATNTLSEYVILIAFLLHQYLHNRASSLHCLSCSLLSKVKSSHKRGRYKDVETIMKKVAAEINAVPLDAFDDRCVPPLKGGYPLTR